MVPALSGSSQWSGSSHWMRTIRTAFLEAAFPRRPWLIAPCWLIFLSVSAAQNQSPFMGVPGHIVEVACTSDHTQTYALYLPSSYTSEKRWPILYFFDPAGRGNRPLVLYRQLAEDYGFIFAGSNNSRNFSSDQAASLNAIWADTHAHLALDERRTYASGFSGGARVAGAMALGCPQCRIIGVIAQGAGYPSGRGDSNDRLLYYFAVGNRDFNWPEIVTIRGQREDRGQPYRVNVFTGSHQWAPPEVMRDAIEWFLLKAMQQGTMPRESPFIEKLFQQALAEAEGAGNSKDPLAQLRAYRLLVSDFNGLKECDAEREQACEPQAVDRSETSTRPRANRSAGAIHFGARGFAQAAGVHRRHSARSECPPLGHCTEHERFKKSGSSRPRRPQAPYLCSRFR